MNEKKSRLKATNEKSLCVLLSKDDTITILNFDVEENKCELFDRNINFQNRHLKRFNSFNIEPDLKFKINL